MSASPSGIVPFRSPKEILSAIMDDKGIKPPQLGDLIGVTRQQVHAVLNGKNSLSEDRIRSTAKVGGYDPDELVKEWRNYALWMKTPQGIDHQLKIDQRETQEEFTLKGARLLDAREIQLVRDVQLISISLDAPHAGGTMPSLGSPNKYCITCHLGGVSVDNVEHSGAQDVVLLPGKSATIKTLERFALCPQAMLQFNGILPGLRDMDIDATFELVNDFSSPANLSFRLRNFSDDKVKFEKGDSIASVCVLWNPYSENP